MMKRPSSIESPAEDVVSEIRTLCEKSDRSTQSSRLGLATPSPNASRFRRSASAIQNTNAKSRSRQIQWMIDQVPPIYPGYQTFANGQPLASWKVKSGYVDLQVADFVPSPDQGMSIQLHSDVDSMIETSFETKPNATYHIQVTVAPDWHRGDDKNALTVIVDGNRHTISLFRLLDDADCAPKWESQNIMFKATSETTTIQLRCTPELGCRSPIVGSINVIEL